MAKTVVAHARRWRSQIVNGLRQQYIANLQVRVDALQREMKEDYAKTVYGWTGDKLYEGLPFPRFYVKLITEGNEPYLQVRSYMSTPKSNTPHKVWYWLDLGRSSFRQPKDSPPIMERVDRQTTRGILASRAFPGYTGQTFRIMEGQIVVPIPARDWSQIIATNALASAKANKLKVKAFTIRGLSGG